jgi:hypothetical protein
MKIDESLQIFINALPHLEPLHFGFKLQASIQKGYCFCPLAKCLSPWRKKYHVADNYSVCGTRHFQGSGLVQHCPNKGDDYHTATAFYLTTLFKKGMESTQAAVHHGTNDQCRYRFSGKPISTYMSLTLAGLCGKRRLVSKKYKSKKAIS